MAKPTDGLPEWASDTDYPADAAPEASTATKVAPTSGQETIGWRPDQIPTAQEMNYWMNLVYQWLTYLDGGSLVGNVLVTGDLHVTGNTQLDGTLAVGDNVTLAANKDVVLSGTGHVKHGSWVRTFTVHPDIVTTGAVSGGVDSAGGLGSAIAPASSVFYTRLDGFLSTDQLTQVTMGWTRLTGSGLPTFDLFSRDKFGTKTSLLAAPTTSSTLTPVTPYSLADATLYVKITCPGTGDFAFYTSEATFNGV